MSKNLGFALLAATLLVIAPVRGRSGEPASPIPVSVVTIISKPRNDVTYITGEIRARIESELSFRVAGRIVQRLVDVGDVVRKGDVLARLDAEEQLADINVAKANLESAQAQLKLAELAFERQQNLMRTRVGTQAGLDQAQEDLATSSERVVAATAQLENARRERSYTELTADADGVITARKAEVGQVAKATQPIFELARDGARDGIFEVQESLYLGKRPAEHLVLSLLADPSREIPGAIREIAPTVNRLTGTIRVKIDIGNLEALQLGAPVVGAFVAPAVSAIEVPWSAIFMSGKIPAVWIVDASSKVALREVKIGRHATSSVEIAEGVSVGDRVVFEGGKFLSPGRAVTVGKVVEE